MPITVTKDRLTALTPEGIPMGRITFPRVRAGLVNIDSITVFPDFRDQGVEETMLEALLTHLETTFQKAALTDPRAQQYLQTHPQWHHLLPGQLHFTTH